VAAAAVLALLVAAGCDSTPAPAQAPKPKPKLPAAPRAERNLAMGTGEPREPQPFTLEQRLLEAVRQNDRKSIERALELGATLQAKDDIGRSTVLLATLDAGDLDLVRWLHEHGAPLDEPDTSGRAALSYAAAEGRLDIVRWLVEHGARVERPDVQKRTPLFHATLGGHTEVVAYLLDHGGNPNAADQFGDTPLIVACAKGHGATAALLLARGADPSLRDQEGRTAKERSAPGVEPCLSLDGS
jgi:ankyrin repeat protein